ncbi:MAG: hypothetical protein PVG21_03525, partial [Gammaproteobacteria bacterium]
PGPDSGTISDGMGAFGALAGCAPLWLSPALLVAHVALLHHAPRALSRAKAGTPLPEVHRQRKSALFNGH